MRISERDGLDVCRAGIMDVKDVECGAARQEGKRKTTEEVCGCSGGGHEEDGKDRVFKYFHFVGEPESG